MGHFTTIINMADKMNTLTKAEMMKRLYNERKEKGMVQFKIWVDPEQLEKLKGFCKTLEINGELNK
jgi:dihydroorotase-like cyclic amidohydrolase